MIDRHTLRWSFGVENFPALRCPTCGIGNLATEPDIESVHPVYSQKMWQEEWSDYDDLKLRLGGRLMCQNSQCGEHVYFSASGHVHRSADPDGYGEPETLFNFDFIYPSPHIIELPNGLPPSIEVALLAVFDVYWSQKQLAANALRQAIESLLDHHGVARKNEKGRRFPLGARIDALKDIHGEHAQLFELFRPLLNAGSHGEEVSIDTLIDILEALEIHLHIVFDKKGTRLVELQESLRVANSKPKDIA